MSMKNVSKKGENVMKKGIFVLSMILVAVLIAGCIGTDQKEFRPAVGLDLDKTSILVKDKSTSEYITATITRNDNVNVDAIFVLRFPQELTSVYPVDINGNRIQELKTRILKGENSKDILQFKIYGTKGEAYKSDFNLKIELWWSNNTKIPNQDKIITITVV
jgi:hypothetical protein